MKKVTIYGAGMSGMIAAINLARDGFEVEVLDREPGYGGSRLYNPSAHTTPIEIEPTSEYIGIDVSPVFHPLIACPWYYGETKAEWEYVSGAVPLGSPDNPRLFRGDLIMCGTISGAMDPMMWFGILWRS